MIVAVVLEPVFQPDRAWWERVFAVIDAVFEMQGEKIAAYRIYIDNSSLFNRSV